MDVYQMECLTVLRVRPLNWKLAASLQAVVLAFDVTAYCMKVMHRKSITATKNHEKCILMKN